MGEFVRIRTARPDEAAAVARLTRTAYAKWVPVIGREPKPMTVDYAAAMRRHRFDLLFDGEGLAGLIETVPEADALLIENVAVEPVFQGQGHGVRLLRFAEALAGELGLTGTRLYTNQQFTANLRLYTALGYVVEREETLATGVAVHMVKRLETPPPPSVPLR